jgi:hypothetical protein
MIFLLHQFSQLHNKIYIEYLLFIQDIFKKLSLMWLWLRKLNSPPFHSLAAIYTQQEYFEFEISLWLTTRRIQHMLLFTQEVNVAMQPCVITCSYLFLFYIEYLLFIQDIFKKLSLMWLWLRKLNSPPFHSLAAIYTQTQAFKQVHVVHFVQLQIFAIRNANSNTRTNNYSVYSGLLGIIFVTNTGAILILFPRLIIQPSYFVYSPFNVHSRILPLSIIRQNW